MTPFESRPPPRTAVRPLVALLVLAYWLLLPGAGGARAEDPVTLSRQGRITDRVGALDGHTAQVATALNRLYDSHRVQLFVAYVRDFSGRPAQSWADATASRNRLGQRDILLAVATHDRRYACSAGAGSALTGAQLADVARTAIEPALRQNDWAGAALGAAGGYGAVLAGRPVPAPAVTPGEADPGGAAADAGAATNLVLPVVVVVGAGAVATYAFAKRRRRFGARTTPGHGHDGGWAAGSREREPPVPPLPELDAAAKRRLVETDDALRTSEEELGFARAQFGEEAAAPFTDAVAFAKGELTVAFRLRQELDDAYPEDEATRRGMLDEIIARCAEADRRLDAESGAFDRLRSLERTAPQALAAVRAAFRELGERAGTARTTLAGLRERYAESASAPVADCPAQAEDRLVFASDSLDTAGGFVESGENGHAAVHVRAAEGAVGQAATLVDAVERRARELTEAAGKLPGALTETETDLTDARDLLKGTPAGVPTTDLQGRIGRAEAVTAEVRRAVNAGPYDPIDALRRVEEADAVLDEALTGARRREEGDRRAGTLLDQALLTARSAVGAAADYVTTHRGAVGSQARTRLAESQRRLEWARAQASTGGIRPALTEAQRADALARQAQELAERDVLSYGSHYGAGGVRGTGGGVGGAMLGGILLGGLFGGGRGTGEGGVGGGVGGGFGGGYGGGRGPGSFGGGGTRGRMGGSGHHR
ncbi:TPM domain-containing protein [Streptomyces sp. NPDC096310]|uniref:TPM domain-containing protein n=1 Tax=Streptomyces sp. NPDC096310 TaxID=3366082 RepID=UPI0038218160